MKVYHKILFTFLVLFTSISLTMAQAGGGIITGKIIDEDGLEVIAANVLLEGTSKGVSTDLDGKFTLNDLMPGEYAISISYISYETKKINNILVNGHPVQLGDIKIGSSSIEMAEVVVSAKAMKNTENALQTLQRKSISTIDGLSSQAFSAIGDSDAGAAMKRVTGVSVEGGKYVFVRGLGGRYSKTTLNGLAIPGLDPDRNTVQMDIFPTNLIDNIIVYKTFMPNLPGSFTGGLVDIATKDFPDEFSLKISAGAGYNQSTNLNGTFLTYQGSESDWLGYDDGTRSIPSEILNETGAIDFPLAATNPDKSGSLTNTFNKIVAPQTKAPPLNHNLSVSLGNQTTFFGKQLGYVAGVSYKQDFTFYENGTTGRYLFIEEGSDTLKYERLFSDTKSKEEILVGAILSGTLKLDNYNKIGLTVLHNHSGIKETRFQDGYRFLENLNYQERVMAYQQRDFNTFQLSGGHVLGENQNLKIEWAGSYSLAKMEQPDLRFFNNAYEENGPLLDYYILPSIGLIPTRYWRNMNENTTDNRVDLTWMFENGTGKKASVKTGVAYSKKWREFGESIYQFNSNSNEFSGDFNEYFSDANIISSENSKGVFVDNATLQRNQYDANSSVLGTYAMIDYPVSSKLKAIAGARLEQSSINFTNVDYDDESLLNNLDVLPSVGLVYQMVEDKMNLRLNYNRTLARPIFKEIAPVNFFEFFNGNFLVGNPDLKRTLIDNMDFRWEYFFKPGELISFSLFYKKFQDPIELTNNPKAKNGEWVFENVEKAKVFGLEMEIRKSLDFLSLPDVSLGTNFTIVHAEASIKAEELENIRFHDPNAKDTRPLYGQSPYIVNAFINYKNEIGTQANLSYNVQGERLYLVETGATPDVFEQAFQLLNLKVSQKINNGLSLSFSTKNLLNSKFERTLNYNGEDYIFYAYKPGVSFSFGVSYLIR